MKTYKVYKDIRKGARIWGLPISQFALMMLSILASLLIIIFSFGLWVIGVALFWNAGWYVGLTQWEVHKELFQWSSVFPGGISNKPDNLLSHVVS